MIRVARVVRSPAVLLCGATLLVSITFASRTALADPIAVVGGVKGKVEVTPARGGPAQEVTFGRALERGDRLVVGAGGSATLLFNDGNVMEVAEKSAIWVGGRAGGRTLAASRLPGEVYASVSKFVAGGSRETGLVALSQLRSAPVEGDTPFLLAPRRTALMTDRPSFSWRAVPGAVRYRVTVSSAEKGELWAREVEGLALDFPPDVAPLSGSTEYLWEVKAFSDLKSVREESSVFEVLDSTRSATVRTNLDRIRESTGGLESGAARYLSGSYLSGLGLLLDAIEQFGALCTLSPSSPKPHAALGDLYGRIGLMDLAAAEYKQALALTREP